MSGVAIVGPGRVGTAVAVALARAGHRVVGAGGGSEAARARFADHVSGARVVEDARAVVAGADLVCITTPDDVIAEVVDSLVVADVLREGQHVVHMAGAAGLAPLRRAALAGCRVAACHPAQTVPSGAVSPDMFVGVAWAVTADVQDRAWAHELVIDLGGDPYDLADEDRVLYHAGLALGSNAVAAAVTAARRLLLAAGVDPAPFLRPLVAASVRNALADGAAALTGPIARGDVGTVRRHVDALDEDLAELAGVYRDLGRAILEQVRPSLDAGRAAELDLLLRPTWPGG